MPTAPFQTEVTWKVQLHSNTDVSHTVIIEIHNISTALGKSLTHNISLQLPSGALKKWHVEVVGRPDIPFDPYWGFNDKANRFDIALDYLNTYLKDAPRFELMLELRQGAAIKPFGTGGIHQIDYHPLPTLRTAAASLIINAPVLNWVENVFLWLTAKFRKLPAIFDMYVFTWENPALPVNIAQFQAKQVQYENRRINPQGILVYQKIAIIEFMPLLISFIFGVVITIISNLGTNIVTNAWNRYHP